MTGAHQDDAAAVAELVDAVAAAVARCPAVAAMHPGSFGEIMTSLPGRRVTGVTWSPAGIVLGVVGRFPATVREIDSQVRAAVTAVTPARPVTVRVADVAFPAPAARMSATPSPRKVRLP